jgi:hypothetical protein
MRSMPGSRSVLASVAIGTLTVLMSATDVLAQQHDGLVDLRIWTGAAGRYVLTDNGTFPQAGFDTVALKVEGSKPTVGGDIEFRVHRWLGIDVGGAYTRLTVNGTSSASPTVAQARLGVVPVFASLNVHLVSTNVLDIWVGPQIGYFFYGSQLSFPFAGAGTFAYSPTNTFSAKGFSVGADVGLASNAALNLAFRWQNGDGDSNGHLTIDPAFATAGLTIRF